MATAATTLQEYPRNCTFSRTDWDAIAAFWYPIAFSRDVSDRPVAATLLDQRLVIWRTKDGVSVANDLCFHRGVPLSMGMVEKDQLICKYHGFHYGANGQCTLIPADPNASIPAKLCLTTYPLQEAYGLIWTTLRGDDRTAIPSFPEWEDAELPANFARRSGPKCSSGAADGRVFGCGPFCLGA
jgi:phenylpropionate dioxygenase-like ring-hydroxylating dioxygenase large terminal subunit